MNIDEIYKKIDEYDSKEKWEWKDYHEALSFLLQIVDYCGLEELRNSNYLDKFYHCLSIALNFAGDMGEVGYDFHGIETIMNYGRNLNSDALYEILKHFEIREGGSFYNKLRDKVRKALICSAGIDDEIKNVMKFRFFDMYFFAMSALKAFDSILAERYSEYKFITIQDINNELKAINKPELNERIFWKALAKDEDKLYVKIDITQNCLFISLTPNSDINDMRDYIDDFYVSYFEDEIILKINKIKGQNVEDIKAEFPFMLDAWGIEEMKGIAYGEKMESFLKNYFKESEIEFELVYFYAKNLRGVFEREVYFRNDLNVDRTIVRNGSIVVTVTEKEKNMMPKDFFGDHIKNVLAVIGKNGKGKTSVFRMIFDSPLISSLSKEEYEKKWGEYFLIYKLNEKYYFTCSDSIIVDEKSQVLMSKFEDHISVNVCLVSNTFDIFEIERDDGYVLPSGTLVGAVDLTTNTFLRTFSRSLRNNKQCENVIDPIQYYRLQETERIENLNKYLTAKQKIQLNLKPLDGTYYFSSGEYARWSLFARIFSIFYRSESIKSKLPEIKRTNNYFLFLDEAELYMHPEWQGKLIYDLLEFLKMINIDGYYFSNLTIVLSSNSPFLMSDLPHDNIHLLDSEGTNKKTFGQNIYTLLIDKFFMPDGTIGKFAYSKLKEAFKEIEGYTEGKKTSLELAEYINNIVGEKAYKYFLEEQLEEAKEE